MELPAPAVSQLIGYPYQPGMLVYDLVGIEGGVLHTGKSQGSHMALTPAERPVEFEPAPLTRAL